MLWHNESPSSDFLVCLSSTRFLTLPLISEFSSVYWCLHLFLLHFNIISLKLFSCEQFIILWNLTLFLHLLNQVLNSIFTHCRRIFNGSFFFDSFIQNEAQLFRMFFINFVESLGYSFVSELFEQWIDRLDLGRLRGVQILSEIDFEFQCDLVIQ